MKTKPSLNDFICYIGANKNVLTQVIILNMLLHTSYGEVYFAQLLSSTCLISDSMVTVISNRNLFYTIPFKI